MLRITICALIATFALPFISNVKAQQNWSYSSESSFSKSGKRDILPTIYKTFTLDFEATKQDLSKAPNEKEIALNQSDYLINLPNPDGKSIKYKLVAYQMMEEALAQKYPNIKTFYGIAVKNPFVRIRLDITERGLRAMVFSPDGNYYIDNFSRANTSEYIVYYKKDYPAPLQKFKCSTDELTRDESQDHLQQFARAGDCTFRSYRLAMATTGEYSNFHGATSAAQSGIVLSEVITSMNRINGIYEIDATVRMILVANTDQLFYYNGGTDPYTNGSGGAMLSENQTNIDNIIGTNNYDIGHVYSTGGGGVAYLRSVCGSSKAGGVTGQGSPINDPFYVDYVAHEMGHQFGGNHTQNNNCNRATTASYEPGSASSIMGYAGICAPNVQNNSDDYFHGRSVEEIGNFVTTGDGNNCDIPLSFNNNAPTVDAGNNYVIPVSTPFVLTAIGNDADGDPLLYCWEQWDPEVGAMPPASTNTQGPMFRTFNPNPSPSRYFPNLNDLTANNTPNPNWEVLPSVNRDLDFRVTVRDNNGTAGCNAQDNMNISTDATTGPFLVLSPNTNVVWAEGATETVTWDEANTSGGNVNCANVDILFSTDGGFTYTTIASEVPNNGSTDIIVPSGVTTTARIMVKCSDNIFFDISNENFEVESGFNYNLTTTSPVKETCSGADLSFIIDVESIGGYNDVVNLSINNLPAGAATTIMPNPVIPGNSSEIIFTNLASVVDGVYNVQVEGSSISGIKTLDLELRILSAPGIVNLSNPVNGAVDVLTLPELEWIAESSATSYELELATDNAFSNIVESGSSISNNYTVINPLEVGTEYFWRVKSVNICDESAWSNIFSFETFLCLQINSTDIPIDISSGQPATITSTIDVTAFGSILDVDVSLEGEHTWMSDLDVTLINPNGDEVILFEDICNRDDNFNLTFNDEAPSSNITCPPVVPDETFQPSGSLSDFDNQEVNGTWTLSIFDDANQDGGSLNAWSILVCLEQPTCNLKVNNNNSDGEGSLIAAIECASSGDTITFEPTLNGQIIQLSTSVAEINKNLFILTDPTNNITVQGIEIPNTFHIMNGATVEIQGLKIIAGSAVNGRGILNEGILTIRDVEIFESNPPIGSGSLLNNLNELKVEGNCNIQE